MFQGEILQLNQWVGVRKRGRPTVCTRRVGRVTDALSLWAQTKVCCILDNSRHQDWNTFLAMGAEYNPNEPQEFQR